MKRAFEEISDDEWANHSFKLSRVLKTTSNHKQRQKSAASTSPPPIVSFAFKKSEDTLNFDSSSSEDCVEITRPLHLEEDDLEEEDLEEVARPPAGNRGRRFIVDDDEDEEEKEEKKVVENERDFAVYNLESSEEEVEEEDLEFQDDDVVGKALYKCAKISLELKKELYGSAVTSCVRYAKVEASSVRIVTQSDIAAACAVAD